MRFTHLAYQMQTLVTHVFFYILYLPILFSAGKPQNRMPFLCLFGTWKIFLKQWGILIAKHPNVPSCRSSPLPFRNSTLDKNLTLMLKLFSLQFPQDAGKFNMNENILWLTLSKHETAGLQTNFELPERRRGIFPDSIEKYDRRYWTWSKLGTRDVSTYVCLMI